MNIFEAWQSGISQIGNFFSNWTGSVWDSIVAFLNSFFGGIDTYIGNWLEQQGLYLSIPENVQKILRELAIGIGYIFPVRLLLPIPIFMMSFYILKLIFALYNLIAGTVIQRIKLNL